jgi:hypothetical protein
MINKIYDVERRANSLSPEGRGEFRAKESRMYLDRLRDWLAGPLAQNLLPSSKLAGALRGTARVEELLPDVWKQQHPEAVRRYRAQERRDNADLAVIQASSVGL